MTQMQTVNQVSAGGVAYRQSENEIEIALIRVGDPGRWQLPKGAINTNETIEDAALREVREETGLTAEIISLLERIEYWFFASRGGKRARFHKFVHFYLMHYCSGSVDDHDHEVEEARWVEINQAIEMLAYASEKNVVRKALERIQA